MHVKRRICIVLSTGICLFYFVQTVSADEWKNLQNLLNKEDQAKDWKSGKNSSQPAYNSAPVMPTPQAFSPVHNSYMQGGMPYASESIPALRNSAVWRYMGHNVAAGAPASAVGGNPFNLSPFGMLHYLWDDTTYVSSANPVTLYQSQNDLQTAQRYSQMAQSAAMRAKYAGSQAERAEAARQAQYYAGMAKQAAQSAQEVAEAGSLNPAEVAQAAMQQANQAQSYARSAQNLTRRGF